MTILRHSLTLIYGRGAVLLVTLVTIPILTRVYEPATFGYYAIFIAVSSLIGPVLTLRYDLALVLPNYDFQAKMIFISAATVAAFGALALAGGVWCLLEYFPFLTEDRKDVSLLIEVAILASLVIGYIQLLTTWHLRLGHFRLLSIARLVQVSTLVAFQIGFGIWIANSLWGLILGSLCGDLVLITVLSVFGRRVIQRGRVSLATTLRVGRKLLKVYSKFPRYTLIGGLADSLSINLLPILVTSMFGVQMAGYFSLTMRVIGIPIGLVARSINNVLLQHFTKNENDKSQYSDLFCIVSILGVLGSTVLVLGAPFLFSVVFSSEWETSGEIAQYIAPVLLFNFVANSMSSILIVKELQRTLLRVQLILLLATVTPFLLAYKLSSSFYTTLFIYTSLQCIAYYIYCYRCNVAAGVTWKYNLERLLHLFSRIGA